MFKTTARAALCLACLWSVTPALAEEANKNVDSLITNRK